MTVLDNAVVASDHNPGESLLTELARPKFTREFERELRERSMEVLQKLRLDAKADECADLLSGGQKKLLELARALIRSPKLRLLDEPRALIDWSGRGRLSGWRRGTVQ